MARLALAACLAALALAAPAAAAPGAKKAAAPATPEAQGEALARRVQRFYARARDFSAAFQQTYDYVAFGRQEARAGTVRVKKPGLVRWEYDQPEKKLLVIDGKSFWSYVPEDNQVMVKRDLKGNEASAAFSFLWGRGDLLAEFSARKVEPPAGLPAGTQGEALELLPKKPGSVQRVVFVVDPKGAVLASVLTDAQGNLNRLVFVDGKLDQRLDGKLFVFEVPKGASVQELP